MSFGEPDRGAHTWTLDEQESRVIIRHALDLGVTFFDTSNSYSAGRSEEIVGRALGDFCQRDEVVIATKVFVPMRSGTNAGGLSRKAILSEVDNSLRRLGTDYIDLYQVHRWDYATPIEETLEVLHEVLKAGKARYIGASSMFAWQFARALYLADRHGWTRFASMQNHYNLLYREEEREMLPLCAEEGIGVLPWSPLARGRLARPSAEQTARSETDEFTGLYRADDAGVVARVNQLAERHEVPAAQVALAWLLRNPVVTAPIVGATKPQHVDDAAAALELELDDADVRALEEPYTPQAVSGHE
jgi:aryl-alcohol dehydrogenase (NADP+)